MSHAERPENSADLTAQVKSVDYRFRIIYAASIVMVVLSHSISVLSDWLPYNGCLTSFMFCSGYFYRQKSENEPWKYILKKARRLLVPLYLYNALYGLLGQVLHKAGFAFGGEFTPYNLLIAPLNKGNEIAI